MVCPGQNCGATISIKEASFSDALSMGLNLAAIMAIALFASFA